MTIIFKQLLYSALLLIGFMVSSVNLVAQFPSETNSSGIAKMQTIGAPINTLDFTEFSPTVSADGNTMIFQSDREGNGLWRLYSSSQLRPGNWSVPKPFDVVNKFIKGTSFLGGACLSYDGKTLYFSSDTEGTLGGIDIWYTTKVSNKWEVPKNAGRGVNTSGYDGFPSVSADGKQLYFMREGKKNTPTGERCCSIYVAERRGSFYINAKPLPAPVNSGCEGYPRIMSDNTTLIYSSYKPTGKGGYDLYESKKRAGKWTTPIPLDFINTIRDDELIAVPAVGDVLYFSNTNSNHKDDIYRIELPKEFRPDKLVTIEGIIREEETQKIIPATIKINNITTKEKVAILKNNETTGKYKIFLQEGEKYDVSISSKGKTFHSEVIDLEHTKKYQVVTNDVTLKALKTNTSFVLNNIFFGFDSANVKTDSELELERVVELLTMNPTMSVEISAYTDDKGSETYNAKLSQARADAVVTFLIAKGIVQERLMAKGYGKSLPAFPNTTDENRAKNRRVEFKVLKL